MRILTLCCLLFSMFLTLPAFAEDERWLDRKAEGWHFYNEEADDEDVEEQENLPPPASPTQISDDPSGPAPLSSAWIRENMQGYLDNAVDNPTPENVAAFLYLQRYAMDRSTAFGDAVQEVTLGHSTFDEISRRPTATFGNRKIDDAAAKNQKSILTKISSQAGIYVFVDGSQASVAQIGVIEMLNRNYQFQMVKIGVGEVPPEYIQSGYKVDKGHSNLMNITHVPAVVLVRQDGVFDVLSQAPVSYSDLQKRLLVGAKRLNVISEAEFNSTRPVANYNNLLAEVPLKEASNEKTSAVPIPASDIVKSFQGKYGQ